MDEIEVLLDGMSLLVPFPGHGMVEEPGALALERRSDPAARTGQARDQAALQKPLHVEHHVIALSAQRLEEGQWLA
jgi:hypothetical protein